MKLSSFGLYFLLAIIALALILLQTGCGVLSTLQVIVDTTAAAVPILQAAGVPIPPALPLYVADVAECIANVNTNNPTTGELVSIAACLATHAAPQVPAGTPQAIANIIAAIAQDVANFLAQNDIQSVRIKAPSGQYEYRKFSSRETRKLIELAAKAKTTATAARAMVK